MTDPGLQECTSTICAEQAHSKKATYAGVWRWSMFLFRVIGWQMYRPQPPTSMDKFKCEDVTLIIPTIDTDEEAMHEAMRSWVLNEPYEILIVTVGEHLQKELQAIAASSLAADITRVLYVEKPANKRIQLVHGTSFSLKAVVLLAWLVLVRACTPWRVLEILQVQTLLSSNFLANICLWASIFWLVPTLAC